LKLSIRDTASFLIASRVPNLIIIGLTQLTTAYFLLNKTQQEVIDIRFGLFLISTAMVGAGGYIINDYFDRKIDLINRPNTVIVGTKLGRRLALFFHALLTFGGIFLGFILDPFVGAIHIFSAGALWTYSGLLKRQILIGTLTISFLTALTMLIVVVYFRQFSLLVIAYAMFGFVTVFIRESVKDIISVKGETAFGVQSIPILWGIRGAKAVIFLAGIAGVWMMTFYMISIPYWNVRYFFIVVFLIVVWAFYKLLRADRLQDFEDIKKVTDMIIVMGILSMFLV